MIYYSTAHPDPGFIHQYVVDAYAAQHASDRDKPIKLTFALVGLFLHVEKGFTGRQVQLAHIKLGRQKEVWPEFSVPENRGLVTEETVLAAPAGPDRDEMIQRWCESVWEAYSDNRETVARLLKRHKII